MHDIIFILALYIYKFSFSHFMFDWFFVLLFDTFFLFVLQENENFKTQMVNRKTDKTCTKEKDKKFKS